MSQGTIVGRISIRVFPDTKDFRAQAQRELNAIEKQLSAKVKLTVDLNGAEAVAEAKKVQADAEKALRDLHIRVNLDDEASLQRAIQRVSNALTDLDATDFKIKLDHSELQGALDQFEQQLDDVSQLHLRVDSESMSSVKRAIARIDAELERLREVELNIDLNEESLKAARSVLVWEMESLKPKVQVDLRINDKSISSMERALAKIEAEIEKLEEVELKVDVDPAKLRAMRDLLTNTIEAERRVKVALDTAHANALQEDIQRALDKIEISPKVNPQAAAKAKREIEGILDRISSLKATITPEMDDQAKRRVERQIDDLKDKVDHIKSQIEPETSKGAVAVVSAALARLTRDRVINLFPKVSMSAAATAQSMLAALSGGRVLNEVFETLSNTLRNLDKTVPIIGTLALAIAGLAGWGLSAASNLFALSSSLAQIGPAALLLPGLLGGIAVGLGVTIAAFKDFNKVIPEAKAALSKLQDTISKNFWEKAAAPIRSMIDELLPEFTSGVAQTATQLGGFFGGLATGLKGALNPALTQMFNDLSQSITIATGGTNAFATIIAVLGKVGTSYLPALAKWFVDISEKFAKFLTDAEADGRLKGWIDTAIQNLKDLGSTLFNIGGIFAGLGRAAQQAGGSTLGMLADTLEHIHKVVDSPGFQSGLVDVFKNAHQAMSNLADKSGPAVKQFFITLGQLLADVLPQVGTILGTALGAISRGLSDPALIDGIKLLFSGIQDAVNALAPAMVPLGQAIGSLLGLAASFATTLGPLVAGALVPLAMAFQAIVPSITPLIGLLGGALLGVIQQLTPVIMDLIPIVQGLLATAFQTLATVLPPIAAVFGQLLSAVAPLVEQLVNALAPVLPVLASALGTILGALMPIVSTLIQIVMAVLKPLIEALSKILAEVLPKLGDALARVSDALQPFLNALLAVVNFIMPILVPILSFLVGILADSLVAAINGVALVLEGLKEVFVGVWDYIKGYFEIIWGVFEGIFTGNWDTFKQGFSDLWDGILGILKGIWDVIIGALEFFLNIGILGTAKKAFVLIKEGFVVGWTLIKTVVIELWDSLGARFSSFMTTLKNTPGAALTEIKNLFKGAWDDTKAAVQTAWDGIKDGVSKGITATVDFVKGLPGKILAVFVGVNTWLLDIGKTLIDGLVDGIKKGFQKVKDTLKDLTSLLPDWKGPATLDKVLLTDAGRLIIDGLINGMESRYDAVRKSLQGLTDDVAGAEFDSPTIGQISTARGASSALAKAVSALTPEGGVTKVLNYYAAPGSSLGSEEDLFAAIDRGRAAGW